MNEHPPSDTILRRDGEFPAAPKSGKALATLSAKELAQGYREGNFTPLEVIEDVLAALRRTQRDCNVAVSILENGARSDAERATAAFRRGEPLPPLAGIPVTVKDLIFVSGAPAKAGSPALADYVASQDNHAVGLLRAKGAIFTAKTTTSESGYKLTGDSRVSGNTVNPWLRARSSGGSSGGAAAAMAAGCGPLALATDAVGSIRVPAAFCGVFGIKPTFGLISRAPGFAPPPWASLVHAGVITRTVHDATFMLDAIAGYDVRDPASIVRPARWLGGARSSPAGLRIAVSLDLGYAAVDPAVETRFHEAVGALAALGAEIEYSDLRLPPELLDAVLKPVAYTEQAAAAASKGAASLALSDPEYRSVIDQGLRYSGTAYVQAGYRRNALRTAFVDLFTKYDALVTPTVAVPPFLAGETGVDLIAGRRVDPHLGWSPFTWPANLVGIPAASVPCGFDADGLPVGFQIMAPWFKESTILAIAGAYEQAHPWGHRWPIGCARL